MSIRKGMMAAVLVTMLGVSSGTCRRCVARFGDSAQDFQQYFHALKQASLSPMERFVYSLVLVNAKPPAGETR